MKTPSELPAPKIIKGPPPAHLFKRIQAKFDVSMKDMLFTYKGAIYTECGITPDLIVHEGVHLAQQDEMGADKWWDKFLEDPKFRLSQELPAYTAQFRELCMMHKDRNVRSKYLRGICNVISSPRYGNMISYNEVYTKLRPILKQG